LSNSGHACTSSLMANESNMLPLRLCWIATSLKVMTARTGGRV